MCEGVGDHVRSGFDVGRPVTPNPGVDLDLVSDLSSEQLVDWNSQGSAFVDEARQLSYPA